MANAFGRGDVRRWHLGKVPSTRFHSRVSEKAAGLCGEVLGCGARAAPAMQRP